MEAHKLRYFSKREASTPFSEEGGMTPDWCDTQECMRYSQSVNFVRGSALPM